MKTVKPVKPMNGDAWTLDVTFATAVASRAPGKPLPADGGLAGKALLALVAAVGGKTLPPILALFTPAQAQSYQQDWRTPAENLESAQDILGARLPKKPKVTGGEMLADDHVVLEVEGQPFDSTKMLCLVETPGRRSVAVRRVQHGRHSEVKSVRSRGEAVVTQLLKDGTEVISLAEASTHLGTQLRLSRECASRLLSARPRLVREPCC